MLIAACLLPVSAPAQAMQQLHQRHLQTTKQLPSVGRMDGNTHLDLAIGLPLRNRDQLTNLLQELYKPGGVNFRNFLTPEKFAASFGPSEKDYQSVIQFAKAHGLDIKRTHPNRTLLDVSGSVADIEKAFHVHMRVYKHPTEDRTFFAPDAEPTVDLATPLLAISGLDSFVTPKANIQVNLHPNAVHPNAVRPLAGGGGGYNDGSGGSGPYGFMGYDFQIAYTPQTQLDGSGQSIGLFELTGYSQQDIADYVSEANLPADNNGNPLVPIQNILIDGFNGGDSNDNFSVECTGDIEMVLSMAPGLSKLYVYEGPTPTNEPPSNQLPSTTAQINDTLNRMATDNLSRQLSCSYAMDINLSTVQIFQQFAAQGQSFFQASGDFGAYPGAIDEPIDDPYITVVGGTALTTNPTNYLWVSEAVWNSPANDPTYMNPVAWASGGGISLTYPIPWWQQGLSTTDNDGSTTMRNVPDVAAVAVNINLVWGNDYTALGGFGLGSFDLPVAGTSLAAPLWAAFTALVNEQAQANGQPPVGFLNPAIYAIGKSANYTNIFHDITDGDNTTPRSPGDYPAATGYDLCTGWGTFNDPLINALLAPPTENLVITQPFGFTSFGPGGGPFSVTSQTYTLTNIGTQPLTWTLANSANWLTVSNTSGTLAPGAGTAVTVNLNSAANNFLIKKVSGNVRFSNLTAGTYQDRQFDLYVGNGGFETGNFTSWTLAASNHTLVLAADDVEVAGTNALIGVPDESFVHSGIYGALLGQLTADTLTHTIATTAGKQYSVSFWFASLLANTATATNNHFAAKWNGATLCDQTNIVPGSWTNMQFTVSATGASSTLEIDFYNKQGAFALDDVTVDVVPPPSGPMFQPVTVSSGTNLLISWPLSAAGFQLQSSTNLGISNSWLNVATPLTTNGGAISTLVPLQGPQQFFRLKQ